MARTQDRVEFDNVVFTAEILSQQETEGWQAGNIDPGVQSDEQLRLLSERLIASLRPVAPEEMARTDCTDGRYRMQLDDGQPVPVRERLVGADIMPGFAMAEALGTRFYGSDKATLEERIDEVCAFLKPSTHGSCGAAGGFVAVSENLVTFASSPQNKNFLDRQKRFVPVFDESLFTGMVRGLGERIANGKYEGYSDALITAGVKKYSGDHAVANYLNDERGVKGHRELAIARIVDISGVSIDTNALAETEADNPQAFIHNDSRLERLASMFGRGHDEDYATAYMAGEAFSDAGWGTLGRNLRTIILRPVA